MENGHHQAIVEPDLESLLPAAAQPWEKHREPWHMSRITTLTLSLRLGDLGKKGGVRVTGPTPA
jgi:hypothetical protein